MNKISAKVKKIKIGPMHVKILLFLRKDQFANDLKKIRGLHDISTDGLATKKTYNKWLALNGLTKDKFEKFLEKDIYSIMDKYDLTCNYFNGVKLGLIYGKNIDLESAPDYFAWTLQGYTGKNSIKNLEYKGVRMFLEVYPETSIDDIIKYWKNHKKRSKDFFTPQEKFRPYKDFLFDLEVYDVFVNRRKGETAKTVAVDIKKKYKNKKSLTYTRVNRIVHKIRSKISSL